MDAKKGQMLGKYKLTEDFHVAGGRSRIAFGEYGGKRWFIKEFLSPKYPTPDSPGSPKTKEYKKKMCQEFEDHQNKIMEVTKAACGEGSNLVCASELFRADTKYYKVTECIDTSTLSPKDVSELAFKDIQIVLRSLTSSVRILHNNNIVHGDLKPDNILIKKTSTGVYTTKLIDFDDSYFSEKPAEDRQMVVGTPEYYSPEVFDYISDEDEEIPGSTLTLKSDIYTLGIIFCEYLTGMRPVFDSEKYEYTYAATKGDGVTIPEHKNITPQLQELLSSMLSLEYEKRPNITQVFDSLKKVDLSYIPTDKKEKKTTKIDSIPVAFPKLKLPASLVRKLHDDDHSGAYTKVDTAPKVTKIETPTEKPEEKPTLKIHKSPSKSDEPTSTRPKLKGSLIK